MGSTEDDAYCRNCGEWLFRIVRHDDGTAQMNESTPEPESDGAQKFYRCPTCLGKNLVMLIDEPHGTRYYQIAGFSRS